MLTLTVGALAIQTYNKAVELTAKENEEESQAALHAKL
jgi:hypothetical protein